MRYVKPYYYDEFKCAREVEYSDENLNILEELLNRE